MFISLIYVSHSLIPTGSEQDEIESIVTASTERNGRLGVRGALLFTEVYFAQLLEGPETAVEEVMESIIQDPRHDQITIIERKPIDGYRFSDWGLAYWGNASYMDRKISTVLHKQDAVNASGQTAQLFELIQRLSHESHDHEGPIGRPSKE
ncbi:blue light sensor protein [Sphingomonas sp. Root710]|uniref:BLUF domain-containing protein n=1 Tax=Sphingomonas sp. Root710 TaxID=1736594 RepID=UPI000701B6EF|nr:BLUF domain-containing protein [Sphingomonas sp. Root710]KRB85405.1 blue light sensor protein [Sphingomonas sp. Root710]